MKYKHATDILPANLIAQIQKHYHSGALWIPAPSEHKTAGRKERQERDGLIVKLYENDISMKEISKVAQITEERVRQIIQRAKKHPNPS